MDILVPILVVGMLFVALPWLILHYVSKWKANSSLTGEDEQLLNELYDLARRLDDRMTTIERIMTDDNPNWKASTYDSSMPQLERPEIHDLGIRLSKDRGGTADPASQRRA